MIVNELKTKAMVFGTNDAPTLYFNNKIIEIVSEYKYLGNIFKSIIRNNGDVFKNNYTFLADKAEKAVFALRSSTSYVGKLPAVLSFQLFDSTVKPIIEYGAEIWGVKGKIDVIERVQLHFIKNTLGVKYNTSTVAMFGECGRFPLYLSNYCKAIKYWLHLKSLPNSNIVKIVYNELESLHNMGYCTWVTNIKSILHLYKLDNIEEEFPNQVAAFNHFKSTIYSCYKNEWQKECNDIVSHPILRTYCTFKNDFCLEPYLIYVSEFKYRSALCKLRVSSHQLKIETGRHHHPKLPAAERICPLCLQNIETEFHFVIECSIYTAYRDQLFMNINKLNPIFNTLNNNDKFIFLMSSREKHIVILVSKYVYKCFNVRENELL